MEFRPVSELLVTDNAWYKMWWFVFILHKEWVTCGGAISEVVNWLRLQCSPLKQLIAFWDELLSWGLLSESGLLRTWGNRAVIETRWSSWQSKF